MNLDDKIKQALQMDANEAEMILSKENGLHPQIFGIFRGGMRNWNIFGMVLATVSGILLFWSGYRFFISDNLDDRLFWGVLVLALWTGVLGQKVWFWLEMNRYTTNREIKRLELAVAQLFSKTNHE